LPSIELKWGKLGETGIGNDKPLSSISVLPGSSDGPCAGISAGSATIEIHVEDALLLAATLIDVVGWSKKKYEAKFGKQEWRWPD
jgi:hypothetical protein